MTEKVLKMPYAECWKRLIDLEIQKIIDALNKTSIDVPISIVSETNTPVGANTMFIATDLTKQSPLKPKNTPCLFRIYVCLSVAGVFSVQRYAPDKQIDVEYMNQGAALAANSGYMFDVLVDQGEAIDFQTTVAATILKLSVVEKDDVK